MTKHILIADDDVAIVAALSLLLEAEGYQVSTANEPQQVLFFIKNKPVDLLLLDLNFQLDTTSGQEGLQLIEQVRQHDKSKHYHTPIVAMTGWGSIELSVATLQKGADDFIEKPWSNERLVSVIHNQLQLAQSRQQATQLTSENKKLKQTINLSLTIDQTELVALSPSSKQFMDMATQVASSDISVLLYGENGSGKSLLAEYIHQQSSRAKQPFVAVNMGAIPEQLFESEMFGHVKGAFTDAKQDRIGRFELANGGTLFLDEVANIPLSQQAKLLRVLESGEFEKVGSNQTVKVDVRVVSATNADLTELAQQQQFRTDLLYRLGGIDLTVPALRERKEDIIEIAEQLVAKLCQKYNKSSMSLSAQAKQALVTYTWPGNVRELKHCIERAVILAQNPQIEPNNLRLQIESADVSAETELNQLTWAQIEQQVIKQRLSQYSGNAEQAAESLGLSRSAFYRRLEKYKILDKQHG